MTRSRILQALTLTAILLAPGALAADEHAEAGHDHAAEARAKGAAWSAMKAALAAGDVAGGRAEYDAAFASGAARQPVAAAAAEAAFAALANLTDPATAAYKAEAQIADKATYAIAYANLGAALAARDATNASAWFDVLSAKFAKAEELPRTKSAMANVSAFTAPFVVATLDAEYGDLMQAKVMKEAAEAPGLILGNPVKAAEEAAEAYGYFLSIQPAFAGTLGADVDAALRADLRHLLDAVLLSDEEEATELAESVRDAVGRYALATASDAKAKAYTNYATAMKANKNVTTARVIYGAAFAATAAEVAPDAHARVLAAFDAAEAALAAEKDADYQVQRQILEKSTYEIALGAFAHEAAEGETDAALEHYMVLVKKFGWAEAPPAGAVAAGRLAAANKASDEDVAAAKATAFEAFFGKVREEIEEVFMHWDDNAKAREKAMEGVVYYAPLRQDVAARLGDPVGEEIALEMAALYEATTAGDRVKAEEVAAEVEKLLVQYEADGAEVSELDAVVSALKGKIEFVAEEYRGYFEALEIGDEHEAAVEMGEAKAFLAGSRKQFESNQAAFEAKDAEAVKIILANFDAVEAILLDVGDLAELEAIVAETVTHLQSFTSASGKPAAEPAGTVHAILGDVEAGGLAEFTVPVTLVGLPQDGSAYQLKVTFDNALLEVTKVDVVFGDVKASDVQNEQGFVRFNGAATGAAAAEQKVADITFAVKGAPTGATAIELVTEDLSDAKSRPYAIGSVSGGAIDFDATSSVKVVEEEKTSKVPFPALAAFGAVAAAAVALGRRKEE